MSDPIPVVVPPAVVTPAPAPTDPAKLPDDHPLVKAFNAQKAELSTSRQRLTEIDEANKTDTEKIAGRITALETENTTLKAEKLRVEVAAAKGVPANLIAGSTQAELEAAADALLAFKGTPGSPLPGNQRTAGPVSQVQEHEETREDRKKRLEGLKR